MKTETTRPDDLWNQRTLSTFQTFAKLPEKLKNGQGMNGSRENYNHRRGSPPCTRNERNNFLPSIHGAITLPRAPKSSNINGDHYSLNSKKKLSPTLSNGHSNGHYYNGSLNRSPLFDLKSLSIPVPIPSLECANDNGSSPQSQSSHGEYEENSTVTLNSPFENGSHARSASCTSYESDISYHPELEDKLVEVSISLNKLDRRFGFSVIGGIDEGFPSCIDEITEGSPADKADLEVGDEILEVNGRSLEDATHTEVISHIHQCIRSRTICLRVKRRSGSKLALDLASQSNVQDAFVIAVEQQARERLEKLSALKRIKPVDMTKLSHQLSEGNASTGESAELNGLIEAATGSPIYVTSVPELSSQSDQPDYQGPSGSESIKDATESGLKSSEQNTPTNSPKKQDQLHTSSSFPSTPSTPRGLSSTTPASSTSNVTVVGVNDVAKTAYPISNGHHESVTTSPSHKSQPSTSSPANRSRRSTSSTPKRSEENVVEDGEVACCSKDVNAMMMNKMVEWEDSGPHREMAVDVPDSFVPRNKTPPRYPPSKGSSTSSSTLNKNKVAGNGAVSKGIAGNGTIPSQNGTPGKPVPPPRINDSVNNNTMTSSNNNINNGPQTIPHAMPRTIIGNKTPTHDASILSSPSKDENERIRKYQEELRKRREQEERHAKEEEFLRTSLRGSKKLRSLEDEREPSPPTGFANEAYDPEELLYPDPSAQKPLGLNDLVVSLQRVQQALKHTGLNLDESVVAVGTLMKRPEFQQVLSVYNSVQDVWCYRPPANPVSAHSQQILQEVLGSLYNCSVPESSELVDLLSRVEIEELFNAHDKIAERERLLQTTESPSNAGESVDDPIVLPSSSNKIITPSRVATSAPGPPSPDDHIKVVRIDKTQEPLGATVRNEGEAVVVGRIVKGGAAEKSGSLHEGDEILEVNGIPMRGKSVNEVCDILARMTGTLTFLIVPLPGNPPNMPTRRESTVHVRAHFDYDPEDDMYLPCRELGISFSKGDVLKVISQEDPNWWQAHRVGDDELGLAGLVPSKSFQEQRETVKQTLLGETETREKPKRGTLLCAKTHKKKKKKIPYNAAFNDDFDAEEIPTYEEVTLYYPRSSFKRPVVLIGPPNIGRQELRQRLILESERFAAAVPHTSRTRKEGEIDGQDYHFISRAQFEADIGARKFVEHGEFEKSYYGTSLEAIRSVVNVGKICVLNIHPQSLKILRSSDLKPYIVFIAPPPLERMKQMRLARGESYKEEDLIDVIEKARDMEEKFGHYFDLVIINNDVERTYHELVQRINYIEREPQWVPAMWLKQ